MRLPSDLVPATLVRRLNRFAALVVVEGAEVVAHLPNSGRMTELLVAGRPLLLAPRPPSAGRRTRYDMLLLGYGGRWVGVDSRLPPALVAEALARGALPPFRAYHRVRREVRLGASRIDLLLEGAGQLYMETKSVNLVEGGRALFPDAPTPRGRRHLGELAAARAQGHGAAVVFVVQRGDARVFSPHDGADPEFGRALREAVRAGVGVWAYRCRVSPQEMALSREIPVEL